MNKIDFKKNVSLILKKKKMFDRAIKTQSLFVNQDSK